MDRPAGFYMPLSLPRRLLCDYLYFASQVPTVPVERQMTLAPVVAARAIASPRPGWSAIFIKAWAMVCSRMPVLRRAYMRWPWPRLYQHAINVASVPVERPYGAEEALFFIHLKQPERLSLVEIDSRLRYFKERELGSSGAMRRQLRMARMPGVIRRLLWRVAMNRGVWRERYMGTFGLTSYGSLGASSLHPLGLLTTTINFGPISSEDHKVSVRIVYDHRVMDGATVARALADLESVLHHEVLAELRYLEGVESPEDGVCAA
jgi:hypothetical protein